jgi:hypothetical protein
VGVGVAALLGLADGELAGRPVVATGVPLL